MSKHSALPPDEQSPLNLLGGKDIFPVTPKSGLDWIAIVRNGLPVQVIDNLLDSTRMQQSTLVQALSFSARTLARRKREKLLSPEESGKIVRLARVVARGEDVFGDRESAMNWLQQKNHSLNQETPLSLLDTDIGAEIVLDTLGRIEHGVFA